MPNTFLFGPKLSYLFGGLERAKCMELAYGRWLMRRLNADMHVVQR